MSGSDCVCVHVCVRQSPHQKGLKRKRVEGVCARERDSEEIQAGRGKGDIKGGRKRGAGGKRYDNEDLD